jgi:hypothetical protein
MTEEAYVDQDWVSGFITAMKESSHPEHIREGDYDCVMVGFTFGRHLANCFGQGQKHLTKRFADGMRLAAEQLMSTEQ